VGERVRGLSAAREAAAFLTPFGGAAEPTPDALGWFPVVGAVVGAGVGLCWWGAAQLWPRAVAAVVAVAADLVFTGMLHFDGVCDAADGLLAPLPAERRLAVMAEPGVGAFGVVVAGALLIGRWAALAATRPAVLLPAALWCASRTQMALVVCAVPYARREGGLASAFAGRTSLGALPLGLAGAVALGLVWRPVAGPVAVGAGAAAAAAVMALAWRRIGGFTGDVLGAAGVVGETVGLLVAAARW